MSVAKWPGAGPLRTQRFTSPDASKAYPAASGIAFVQGVAVSQSLGGLPRISAIYQIPFPVNDPSIVNFSFPVKTADGSFVFLFKWFSAISLWNCWVTMPDNTIRPAGCIPLVLNWMGYRDFSLVFIDDQPSFGIGDLVGSTMLLVKWHP